MADDHGIELELAPSPDTNTDRIHFFIEGNDPSVRTRFEPRCLLVNAWLDSNGYQLFHPANGLRLEIELWR
jgi:hypothetical protein